MSCRSRASIGLFAVLATYTAVVGSYADPGTGIATGTYRFRLTR